MDSVKKHPEIKCFVTVATIVAQLEVILTEAKSLSLTSKNARVVAIRAGEDALGFKSITNLLTNSQAARLKQLSILIYKQVNCLNSP